MKLSDPTMICVWPELSCMSLPMNTIASAITPTSYLGECVGGWVGQSVGAWMRGCVGACMRGVWYPRVAAVTEEIIAASTTA